MDLTPTDEGEAQDLLNRILAACAAHDLEETTRLIKRVQDEFVWSYALNEKLHLRSAILSTLSSFPDEAYLRPLTTSIVAKLINDCILVRTQDTNRRWWEELTPPPTHPTRLRFKDVTANHKTYGEDDIWGTEQINASLDEPFSDAFQRFRVLVNKKYRHPFLPSLDFDIVLLDGEDGGSLSLMNIKDLNGQSVRDMVGRLQGELLIPYIRNDDHNIEASSESLAFLLEPWLRTLPSWFPPTPSHWLDPIPPPSFGCTVSTPSPSTSSPEIPVSYMKVPLINFPGNGRNILPSVCAPALISSHIFVTVGRSLQDSRRVWSKALDSDTDHVPTSEKLIPPISVNHARSLLGRFVQFSREPLHTQDQDSDSSAAAAGPSKRKVKRSKPTLVNGQDIAAAWGYDPDKRELHCLIVAGRRHSCFILDLSAPASEFDDPALHASDPHAIGKRCCQWVGVVTTVQDRIVLEERKRSAPPSVARDARGDSVRSRSMSDYVSQIKKLVSDLNASGGHRLFEVREYDTLLIGDVRFAKATLDFEVVVENLKPGIWRSIFEEESNCEIILMWRGAGTIEYTRLPDDPGLLTSTADAPPVPTDVTWDILARYSVDGGVSGAFVASTLEEDQLLITEDFGYEIALEVLMDMVIQSRCRKFAVPGGVISAINDGGYSVSVLRDETDVITAVKFNRRLDA